MDKKHTPEPWAIFKALYQGQTVSAVAASNQKELDISRGICIFFPGEEANARRIVACVNALEGVDTDRLETANSCGSGFWGKCIHDSDVKYSELAILNKALTAQRDELLAALKRIRDESMLRERDHLDRIGMVNVAREAIERVENA